MAQVPERASLRAWCWSQDLEEEKELALEKIGWAGVGTIRAEKTASAKVLGQAMFDLLEEQLGGPSGWRGGREGGRR